MVRVYELLQINPKEEMDKRYEFSTNRVAKKHLKRCLFNLTSVREMQHGMRNIFYLH